jgi:hypothetical protein
MWSPDPRGGNDPHWSLRRNARPWIWIALLWGFFEGTFFFLIPDIFISAGALLSLRRSLPLVFATMTGACLGGLLLYTWSTQQPERSLKAVEAVPYVKDWMTGKTRENWEAHGTFAIYHAPTQGIPYKLNAVMAPSYTGLRNFLLHSIPSRGYRFALAWLIAGTLGCAFRAIFKNQHDLPWLLGLGAIYWIINYAIYWTLISQA